MKPNTPLLWIIKDCVCMIHISYVYDPPVDTWCIACTYKQQGIWSSGRWISPQSLSLSHSHILHRHKFASWSAYHRQAEYIHSTAVRRDSLLQPWNNSPALWAQQQPEPQRHLKISFIITNMSKLWDIHCQTQSQMKYWMSIWCLVCVWYSTQEMSATSFSSG